VEDGTTKVSLYANWEKKCTIEPEVEVKAEENQTIYTLIDSNTGAILQEAEGYQIHYQWQICKPIEVGTAGEGTSESLSGAETPGENTIEPLEDVSEQATGDDSLRGPGVSGRTPIQETAEIGPGVTGPAITGPEEKTTEIGPGVTQTEEKTVEIGPGVTTAAEDSTEITEATTVTAGESFTTGPATNGSQVPESAPDLSSIDNMEDPGEDIVTGENESEPEDETIQLTAADPSDESAWEDIAGADAAVYVREAEPTDSLSYFRVMISVEKATYYRAASEPFTMFSQPVSGKSVLQTITVVYQPGAGAGGTAPVSEPVKDGFNLAPEPNTFTSNDGKVFTGWSVGLSGVTAAKQDGTSVRNGETITGTTALTLTATAASPTITLTAQWSSPLYVYLDGANGDDGNNGSSSAAAVKTINRAYALLSDTGTVDTNRIVLCGAYTISGNNLLPAKAATITSTDPSAAGPLLTFASGSITRIAKDTTFENINIKYSQTGVFGTASGIYASGYTLTMGMGGHCQR